MKILDRYILREMTSSFFLGLTTFTFILLMNKILRLVELIVNRGIGVGVVLQLLLFILPYSLVVTIPMATLLATLAAFGRLAADGEVVALKAAGVSLYRLTLPALAFATGAYLATLAITVSVLPFTNHAFKSLVFQMTRSRAAVALQEGVFNSDFEGLILFVEHIDRDTQTLDGVFLIDARQPREQRVIIARQGRLSSDPERMALTLELSGGYLHISPTDSPGRYRVLSFDTYQLGLNVSQTLAEPLERPKGNQEMTLTELREHIEDARRAGQNWRPYAVEFHKKLAIPVSCLLFGLVGPSLGAWIRRGGRGTSLALSVAFALLYYVLIVGGESLADRGLVPPAAAMWAPNVLLALLGIVLFRRSGQEAPPLPMALTWRLFGRAGG